MALSVSPQSKSDQLGISLSGLCLAHCMLMPILLGIVPIWTTSEVLHSWLHPLFLAFIIPASARSFYATIGNSNAQLGRMLLLAGLFTILLASFIEHAGEVWISASVITVLGSVLLISGHWQNIQSCKQETCTVHETPIL